MHSCATFLTRCCLFVSFGLAFGAQNIGYFWQLNDLHLDLNYSNTFNHTPCRGQFGDYKCDSPQALIFSALNATRHLLQGTRQPDFIIWNGDNGPHLKGFTEAEMVQGIQLVSSELQRLFPPNSVYILPTLGNHDVVPANKLSPADQNTDRQSWCHRLASEPLLWGPWIHLHRSANSEVPIHGLSPPKANFSTGCFFSHLLQLPELPHLLLISLNGLLWYTNNPLANTSLLDPLGQLDWLAKSLTWARQTHTKVILSSHFPPGASENSPERFQFFHPVINKKFITLLQDNADIIMAGMFAHTHVDSFRVVYDKHGSPVVPLFISPSVSPYLLRGLGSFNPRIRLSRYDRSSGLLLGYSQYFLNISSPNPTWALEYDTRDEYKLQNLSASSLDSLLKQFENDNSPNGVWSSYWSHELGRRPHDSRTELPDGLCPRAHMSCRCKHLCAMRYVDLDSLDTCLSSCAGVHTSSLLPPPRTLLENRSNDPSTDLSFVHRSSLPIIVGVIIVFLVILVGVVLVVNRDTCRNHRGHGRRLIGTVRDGTVMFTTLNGNLPRSPNGDLCSPSSMEVEQFSDIEGSSAELRRAFHPKYITDANNSIETVHTCDETSTVNEKRFPMRQMLSKVMNLGMPDVLRSPANYFQRDASRSGSPVGKYPANPASQHGDRLIRNAESSTLCRTEDYYADAEDDDDDDPEPVLGYDYSGSEEDFEHDEQSFSLEQGLIPLTKSNKPVKRSNKANSSCSNTGRHSVSGLTHSQSATITTLQDPEPKLQIQSSHSAAITSSPLTGNHLPASNFPEGEVNARRFVPGRHSVGYEYMRI